MAAPAAALAAASGATGAQPHRIDVHQHCFPTDWFARRRAQILASSDNNPSIMTEWTPQRAIDEMDQNGIKTGIVSVGNPGVWYGNVQEARDLSRSANDYMARMARDFPGRFGVFAALPLPDPEGCLREIEYAVDTLKVDGFHLLTSYGDQWPGDPAFAAVFDELDRRKAVVFVHPTAPNCCAALQKGVAASIGEFPFDEMRAVMSLLYGGTFSRCPDIRFIFTHAGGPVPVLATRMEQELRHPEVAKRVPRGVAYELKRLYFDVANSTVNRGAMAALRLLVPQSQILFGTDFPYIAMPKTVKGLDALKYPSDLDAAIDRGNAVRLFPRFA
jgi:predicted TIM-barrel fold metal-dependent hydrolase